MSKNKACACSHLPISICSQSVSSTRWYCSAAPLLFLPPTLLRNRIGNARDHLSSRLIQSLPNNNNNNNDNNNNNNDNNDNNYNNALAMPKLLYILRTAPCSNNPRLSIFDDTLRQGLSTILNVSLSDDQWLQASLPVQKGGLGIRSAGMLASSAYLASAAATLRLQNAILANSCCPNPDPAVGEALIIW